MGRAVVHNATVTNGSSEGPPSGGSASEVVAWYEEHEKGLRERGALEPLLPHLGDVVDVEVVDGENSKYPGLTFDFALRVANGGQLSVEVTQIVLPENEKEPRDAKKFGREIEYLLRERNIEGRWSFSFGHQDVAFKGLDREHWLAEMQLLTLGERAQIDGCEVWRHFSNEPLPGDLRVLTGTTYNHLAAEPEMRRRFGEAIDANEAKLIAAGEAGFDETHLIAWHIFPGSTEDWGEEVTSRLDHEHPQRIWVLSNFSDVAQLK
jgi:hypothetical protein